MNTTTTAPTMVAPATTSASHSNLLTQPYPRSARISWSIAASIASDPAKARRRCVTRLSQMRRYSGIMPLVVQDSISSQISVPSSVRSALWRYTPRPSGVGTDAPVLSMGTANRIPLAGPPRNSIVFVGELTAEV